MGLILLVINTKDETKKGKYNYSLETSKEVLEIAFYWASK